MADAAEKPPDPIIKIKFLFSHYTFIHNLLFVLEKVNSSWQSSNKNQKIIKCKCEMI